MRVDDEYRIEVVKAWFEARRDGHTQEAFCDAQAIALQPRTLRLWIKNWGHLAESDVPSDMELVERVISSLNLLMVRLRAQSRGGVPDYTSLEHEEAAGDESLGVALAQDVSVEPADTERQSQHRRRTSAEEFWGA